MHSKVKEDRLSDGSKVYSVVVSCRGHRAIFYCVDAGHAQKLHEQLLQVVEIRFGAGRD